MKKTMTIGAVLLWIAMSLPLPVRAEGPAVPGPEVGADASPATPLQGDAGAPGGALFTPFESSSVPSAPTRRPDPEDSDGWLTFAVLVVCAWGLRSLYRHLAAR